MAINSVTRGWAVRPRASTDNVNKSVGDKVEGTWVVKNLTGAARDARIVTVYLPPGASENLIGTNTYPNLANGGSLTLLMSQIDLAGFAPGTYGYKVTFEDRAPAASTVTTGWGKIISRNFTVTVAGWSLGDLTVT